VLTLAGAEQRRKPFAEFCYRDATQSAGFCGWLKRGGVDLLELDPRMEANHRDPRVKVIVAVDPAFTQSYDETSLKGISVPVQFLNLGTRATTPSIVEAHGLAQMVPGARIARVPDAVHFSFLGLCKPEGAKLLQDMGDDPVCTDAGGRDRAALHEEMLTVIIGFLAEALPTSR
jgi:predicted dienelactone hydrolase